jgi:hypothetical protein
MLADPVELLETEEEGITIHNHLSPIRILGAEGRVTGLETLDVARAFDEQGGLALAPATPADAAALLHHQLRLQPL